MTEPADCQQRPGAHYRRIALLALSAALLLAACGGPERVRPEARRAVQSDAWADAAPVDPARANAVLMRAISLVGTPYRYGGNTPDTGFDCSGLVNYVYRDMLGMRLPRTSRELFAMPHHRIEADRLASGDLVFFATEGAISHVGIYVGDGRFVHAPSTGGTVRLDRLDGSWWRRHYSGARRLLN